MEQMERHDRPPSQHGKELCLLSLDGGGVRGLSSLYILDELMRKVNPKDPPKPCDYFDMIGGTSTGGLIAIMLGRLEMTIQECIDAYTKLSDKAFRPLRKKSFNPMHRVVEARFDTAALEAEIKKLIVRVLKRNPRHESKSNEDLERTLLWDIDSDAKCRVFVTAVADAMPDQPTMLTSYESTRWPQDLRKSVTIWQAARATSAACSFFEPIRLGPHNELFRDGATGANNPVNQVYSEAKDTWQAGEQHKYLEDDIQCLVSIGTGEPSVAEFGRDLKKVVATLKSMATDTERTAEEFRKQRTTLASTDRYFRFNVRKGLENVGLQEAAKLGEIATATRRYLATEDDKERLEKCAKNLGHREWRKRLSILLNRAKRDHTNSSSAVCSAHLTSNVTASGVFGWLKRMPDYQAWSKSGKGSLCLLDSEDGNMSTKVERLLPMDEIDSLKPSSIIYLDCDQHPPRDSTPELWALHALFYQLVHVNRHNEEGLVRSLRVAGQPLGQILDRLLDETASDYQEKVESLSLAINQLAQLETRRTYLILSKMELSRDGLWKVFMTRVMDRLQDIPYVMMISRDQGEVRKQLASSQHIATSRIIGVKEETEQCIQSLCFSNWDERRLTVQAPYLDTHDWIWTNPAFKAWKAKGEILWIKGKPGSGKSTIAKMITDEFLGKQGSKDRFDTSEASLATFFYSGRLGDQGIQHVYMLRSILYQLLDRYPQLYKFFKTAHRTVHETNSSWQLEQLLRVLETILKDASLNLPDILCVLDGYDESRRTQSRVGSSVDQKTMLSRLVTLATKNLKGASRLRLIILSRENNSIAREIGTFPFIVVENNNSYAIKTLVRRGLEDIRPALCGWMESDRRRLAYGVGTTKSVIDEANSWLCKAEQDILDRAAHSILWVVLKLRDLKSHVGEKGHYLPSELRDLIQRSPQNLQELYEDLVKRLCERLDESGLQKAKSMLLWVYTAARPLRLDEFEHAFALRRWKPDTPLEDLPQHLEQGRMNGNWAALERIITDMTGCLLEVVKVPRERLWVRPEVPPEWLSPEDIVQLTHQSARDFLVTEKAGRLQLGDCTTHVSTVVAAYLRSSVLALKRTMQVIHQNTQGVIVYRNDAILPEYYTVVDLLAGRPLLKYISMFAGSHLTDDEIESLTDYTTADLCELLGTQMRLSSRISHNMVDQAVQQSLREVRQSLWNQSNPRSRINQAMWNHIFYTACEQNHASLVRYMTASTWRFTRIWEQQWKEAFRTALESRDASVFETLIIQDEIPLPGDPLPSEYAAALRIAIQRGYDNASEILVHHSQNLLSSTWAINETSTACPFHYAAMIGNQSFIQFLLELGWPVDYVCTQCTQANRLEFQTPLIVAADYGQDAMIEFLLARTSNCDIRDNLGHTAMYYAVQRRHERSVRALSSGSNGHEYMYQGLCAVLNHDLRPGVHLSEPWDRERLIPQPLRRRYSWISELEPDRSTRLRKDEGFVEIFRTKAPPSIWEEEDDTFQDDLQRLWKARNKNSAEMKSLKARLTTGERAKKPNRTPFKPRRASVGHRQLHASELEGLKAQAQYYIMEQLREGLIDDWDTTDIPGEFADWLSSFGGSPSTSIRKKSKWKHYGVDIGADEAVLLTEMSRVDDRGQRRPAAWQETSEDEDSDSDHEVTVVPMTKIDRRNIPHRGSTW